MNIEQSTKSLWDIADAIEVASIELERLQYMLQILNEGLEDEVTFLGKGGPAQHFVSRYNVHRAQLEMVELWLCKTRHEVCDLSDIVRKIYKTSEATA